MMQMISQYVVARMQDERGAEMVEWVLWVGALATVSLVAVGTLGTGISGAITTITGFLPGGGS